MITSSSKLGFSIMTSTSLAARLPKIHLHCHLEGSLRAATFLELASKHGVPLRYKPKDTRESSFDTPNSSAPAPFDYAQDKLAQS